MAVVAVGAAAAVVAAAALAAAALASAAAGVPPPTPVPFSLFQCFPPFWRQVRRAMASGVASGSWGGVCRQRRRLRRHSWIDGGRGGWRRWLCLMDHPAGSAGGCGGLVTSGDRADGFCPVCPAVVHARHGHPYHRPCPILAAGGEGVHGAGAGGGFRGAVGTTTAPHWGQVVGYGFRASEDVYDWSSGPEEDLGRVGRTTKTMQMSFDRLGGNFENRSLCCISVVRPQGAQGHPVAGR